MRLEILAAHVLASVLAVAVPLTGPLERRIYRTDPNTSLKLIVYGVNIAVLWASSIAAIWILTPGRLFESPGERRDWLWAPTVSRPALGLAMVVYVVVALLPLIQSLRGPRWRAAYAAAYRRGLSDVAGLLPKTASERAMWIALSLTAGLCEEMLYRGFLIHYLHDSRFEMPVAVALLASSLVFGVAHAYQGFRGIAGTAVSGLGFGLVFLLSGSLIPSIVLHILIDLQVAFVLQPIRKGGYKTVHTS